VHSRFAAVVCAFLAGLMPAGALAQNVGPSASPAFTSPPGVPGLQQRAGPIDVPGKARPAAVDRSLFHAGRPLGRHRGSPGLDLTPNRLDAEAGVNASVKSGKVKVSGEKETSAAGASRRSPSAKADLRHLPTCD